ERAKSLAREISDRDKKLTAADQELADLLATMAGLEGTLDERDKKLADASKSLADLRILKQALERDLASRDKELAGARSFRDKFIGADALAQKLKKEIDERRKELTLAGESIQGLQAAKRKLERSLDERDKELTTARAFRDKLTASDARVQLLEKEIGE